jgi:hypothetical protein
MQQQACVSSYKAPRKQASNFELTKIELYDFYIQTLMQMNVKHEGSYTSSKINLYRVTYMPPIESPAAASIPFINLFASMASSVENKGLAEPT